MFTLKCTLQLKSIHWVFNLWAFLQFWVYRCLPSAPPKQKWEHPNNLSVIPDLGKWDEAQLRWVISKGYLVKCGDREGSHRLRYSLPLLGINSCFYHAATLYLKALPTCAACENILKSSLDHNTSVLRGWMRDARGTLTPNFLTWVQLKSQPQCGINVALCILNTYFN